MITRRSGLARKLTIFGILALGMIVTPLFDSVPAMGLSRLAPDPADDTTSNGYWYVVSQTPYVQIDSMESKVFFNNNGGHTITIENANLCAGGSDEGYGNQANGTNSTRFTIWRVRDDGSLGAQIGSEQYGIRGACANRTFNVPANSLIANDDYEGGDKFAVIVRAVHVGAWNTQNSFKVRSSSGVVGMASSSDARNSGLQSGPPDKSSYDLVRIPTRTPCTVTSGSIWRAITIFDPDNGVAGVQPAKMRVRVLHNGNPLPASRYNPGPNWTGNAQDGYMPGSSNNTPYSLGVNWRAGEKYVIQLRNVYGNNTLQVGIPFDSAPFDLECNNLPTGRIIDVDCTSTQGQAIIITSRDPDGSTQSRIRIGPNASPNYTSPWGADGRRTITVPNGTGGMNFTAGSWVIRLDVRNKLANGSFAAGYETVATDNTVRCVTPPVATNNVRIRPIVDPPTDPHIEPTETTTFTGRVNVSNFPATNQWGYDEIASRAMPQEVPPTADTSYRYSADTTNLGRATAQRDGCASRNRAGDCVSWYWTCDGVRVGSSATRPTCPHRGYRHVCATYTRTNSSSSHQCDDKTRYTCPQPNGRTYIRLDGNPPDCNVYRCQYAGAPNYITASPSRMQCERRCNNGRGARPPLYSQGDFNCYQRPSFTLRCIWDDGDRVDVVVRNNGDHCIRTKQKQGETIAVPICSAYLARNPNSTGGWQPNPPSPGYGSTDGGTSFRQIRAWGWIVNPTEDEKCVRVVAKPTVKIRGGDVSVGGAFANSGVCSAGPSSSIIGWPHSPVYDASGTQLGAFASRDIFGFATATINANDAVVPRGLAFANSPPSGGDRYGGSFGPMPCLSDHNGAKPTNINPLNLSTLNTPNLDGSYQATTNQITNSPTIRNGSHLTVYVNGDLYIGGTGIFYERTGWANTTMIPSFKVVVYGGNIYIDPSVTQLDGVYVAQPNGGTGGNIYTCATAGGPIPNISLYNSCRNGLTVNGAFVARQVNLGRTEGTAIFGETAEEFNYLPEMWLGQWPQDNTSMQVKYDAMISLPPIL